jgi:hypothetical protein
MSILQTSKQLFELFPFLKPRTPQQEHELWSKSSKYLLEFEALKRKVSTQTLYTEHLTPEQCEECFKGIDWRAEIGGGYIRPLNDSARAVFPEPVLWLNTERYAPHTDDMLYVLVHEYLHYLTINSDLPSVYFKTGLSEAPIDCMAATVMYRLTKDRMVLKRSANYLRAHRDSSSHFYNQLLLDASLQRRLDLLCQRVYTELTE